MEALLFMLDSFVVIVMVFMGLRDDRRQTGAPPKSWFRTIEDEAAPAAPPKTWHEELGF